MKHLAAKEPGISCKAKTDVKGDAIANIVLWLICLRKFCKVSHNFVAPHCVSTACYGESHPLPFQTSKLVEASHVNLTRSPRPPRWRPHQPPSSPDFCLAAPFFLFVCLSEHQHIRRALGAIPPAHDQVCFDAASLSFTASMRSTRRHTNIQTQRDCVNKRIIKKKAEKNKCLQQRTLQERC